MYIIGIDPGKTGAAAHIQDGRILAVYPFKGEIDRCRFMKIHQGTMPPTIFIERVTASPNMGVTGAFTFGRWAEAVESAAVHSGCEIHIVRPQVWQNAIGVFSEGVKSRLYAHAIKLFPNEHQQKMFNTATSDSVLIAYYGWRYMLAQKELHNGNS